jgi:FkbM family methyltransferase
MGLWDSLRTSLLWHASAHRGVPWRLADGTELRIHPEGRWIRNDDYERPVVDYLRANVRSGQTCLDVGAHVGYYVLQLAHWTRPSGRIVAFEPNPTARAALTTNVRLNALTDRVVVEQLAVGAGASTAWLANTSAAHGISRVVSVRGTADVPIEVVALDDYCASRQLSPEWVLIDVEGLELGVLTGAQRLLAGPAGVLVEMHPSLWPDPEYTRQIRALIEAAGRRIVPLAGQNDPYVDYGVIALEPAGR